MNFIPALIILTIVFYPMALVLKLFRLIDCSWWWFVAIPIGLMLSLLLALAAPFLLVVLIGLIGG